MFKHHMTKMRNLTRSALSRFGVDERGAAAIEFAFIAPLLITMYLGTMEISQGIEANKKVGRSASIIGDIIAQSQTTISVVDVQDILKIGSAIMQPYTRTLPTITITAINIDAAQAATVAWSHRINGTTFVTSPLVVNSPITVPANLNIASTFLIKVQTSLEYLPLTSWSIQKNRAGNTYAAIDMNETYYLRPRVSTTVACPGC